MVRIRFYDPDEEDHPHARKADAASPKASDLIGRGYGIDWVGQLGWRENPFIPFTARPAQMYFVGHDAARKSISDFLARGEHLATVTGELGIGKTMFLAWLTEELGKHPRDYHVVNLVSRESPEEITKKLAAPYRGLFSTYTGETNEELAEYLTSKEKKRRIVLLIDDAENLGENEALINALLDAPNISVVIAGERIPKLAVKPLHIPLTPITPLHAEELIEARIRGVGGRGLRPFTSRVVADLWKAAQGDPTRFFHYAEETAMRAATGQIDLEADEEDSGASDSEDEGADAVSDSSGKKTKKSQTPDEDISQKRAHKKRTELDSLLKELIEDEK